MEKANVEPVHKKEDKMLVKKYRPIRILPVFGKNNPLFNYFISNRLFTPSNLVFFLEIHVLPNYSQQFMKIKLLWMLSQTDVREVFLDILKALDKVWHDEIMFKLKSYGVESKLFSLLKNSLENWEQRVVLNRQASERRKIMTGVLQGSALGPLLFVIYTNDLSGGINSLRKIFADDSFFQRIMT